MIQIVIKKYKYLIVIFIILFGIVMLLYPKKENVYILYKGKPSNCFNVDEHDKEKYFAFCKGKSSIFFEKNTKHKTINSTKINIISEEVLFKRFSEFGSGKEINFFIIEKKVESKKVEVIPVKKAKFWY